MPPCRGCSFHCCHRRGCWCWWAMGNGRRRGWRGGGWCCDAATRPRRGCGFYRRRGCGCWFWWAMGDGRRETGDGVVGGVVRSHTAAPRVQFPLPPSPPPPWVLVWVGNGQSATRGGAVGMVGGGGVPPGCRRGAGGDGVAAVGGGADNRGGW